MLNIGMETLFLTALIVVALVVLLFYVVAVKLETNSEIASTELKKKLKKKNVQPLKETKAPFLKELSQNLKSVPAETPKVIPKAPDIQEIVPIKISEAAPVEPSEKMSVETSETKFLEPPKPVPVEPPETVSKISESPKEAPAEVAKEPGPPGCPYHLGYLRSRPRDSFVPDACLSCPRILDCLHKEWLKK
jgi:hypothetical protein